MNSLPGETERKIINLKKALSGELHYDEVYRILYATDASVYKELPLAVAIPSDKDDLKKLVRFASEEEITLIPRTAGTSLAGQVVGNGIIVDFSKHFTHILEINPEHKWIRVEPGVVLDEMNMALKEYDLFFAPETSTSSRCMIGGMIGNNSCGANSLIYGSTREHTISVKALLSDGSEAEFGNLNNDEFERKCTGDSLENRIYRNIKNILSDKRNQQEIINEYPDRRIRRRNTGYALDILLHTSPFSDTTTPFNFCKLLAGSEGTLALITEIKLQLSPLPPPVSGLICAHFNSLTEAFRGNLIALDHKPAAIELMDSIVLEQTKNNLEHRKNRFFIKGEPAAILIIEFKTQNNQELEEKARNLELSFRDNKMGYHFPLITGEDITRVWATRKAGLGLLSNIPGDHKPVAIIEDTAVHPEHLPDYLEDFREILNKYKLKCVFFAHIATGELHLRPLLNLKNPEDVQVFRNLGFDVAHLVKKYRGSMSGEHGDGRLRGIFIPTILGRHNYNLLKEVKRTWDPKNIFNAGKIIDTPEINICLRHEPGVPTKEINTIFDFSKNLGIIRAAEQCNGSGDCRKTDAIGGVMCPTYMATRDEDKTTRARANILREFLSNSNKKNPFNHREIYNIMDLCISCKGCKTECPSSVDITKLKAEFLHHYYQSHRIPLRTGVIAYQPVINKLIHSFSGLYNLVVRNKITAGIIKSWLGFTKKREFPILKRKTLSAWIRRNTNQYIQHPQNNGKLYLFVDEFINFHDTELGIKTIMLLQHLGYEVLTTRNSISGRTFLSKGLLKKARYYAKKNILLFHPLINDDIPLVGVEPSAILSFRDEYPDLFRDGIKNMAQEISRNTFTIDEFFEREINAGKIRKEQFTRRSASIKLHGHCYQKALSGTKPTVTMLSLPENYVVNEIRSGCCGMAGSFGYEKEHYDLSMQIGELILFPEIRNMQEKEMIAAPGTSCRQQIFDGTGTSAMHPVEILYDALVRKPEYQK